MFNLFLLQDVYKGILQQPLPPGGRAILKQNQVSVTGPTTPVNYVIPASAVNTRTLIGQSTTFTNNSSKDQQQAFSYSEQTTDSVDTTRTEGVTYEIGSDTSVGVEIKGIVNVSQSISFKTSISNTTSVTKSFSKQTTWSNTTTLTIPPYRKLLAQVVITQGDFSVPLDANVILSGGTVYETFWVHVDRGPIINQPYVPISSLIQWAINNPTDQGVILSGFNPASATILQDGTVRYKGLINMQGKIGLDADIKLTETTLSGAIISSQTIQGPQVQPTILFQ